MLLNESGMQNHPLTPMTDANLVRVLQAQTRRKVGLIDHRGGRARRAGDRASASRSCRPRASASRSSMRSRNDDLLRLGPALAGMPLVTAGSGVAIGLPANFGIAPSSAASALPPAGGAAGRGVGQLLAGDQPAGAALHRSRAGRRFAIDPLRIAAGDDVVGRGAGLGRAAAGARAGAGLCDRRAGAVKAVQGRLGVEDAGAMVERTIAAIARGLVAARRAPAGRGRRRDLRRLRAGARHRAAADRRADRSRRAVVPCAAEAAGAGLHIALKSGNFGTDDFFCKAFTVIG